MRRIIYLDIIRILACVMIVSMHAPISGTAINSYVLSADSLLTAPGIGLFIMVSGALLLPVKISTKDFIKRRLGKAIAPTLFWTLFYFVFAPYTDTVSSGNGLLSFLSIPFSAQFNGVLWFMYMLIGLYLLAPVLSAWLRQANKSEVELYLALWAITLCYPLIRNIIIVNESNTGILYYFGGYAGYFLLGYYLKEYVRDYAAWKCLALLIVPLIIAVATKVTHIEVDFYDVFWYLSILVAMMSIAWFLLIKKVNTEYSSASKSHQAIVLVSNCCFGIYLVHIFVMRALIWHWPFIQQLDDILQIVAVSLLTFAGSFAITWFISYLPFAEYIIGFKQKK